MHREVHSLLLYGPGAAIDNIALAVGYEQQIALGPQEVVGVRRLIDVRIIKYAMILFDLILY